MSEDKILEKDIYENEKIDEGEDEELYDFDEEVEENNEEEKKIHLTPAAEKIVPTMEEALTDLGDAAVKELSEDDVEITSEDIKTSLKTSMFTEDKDIDISEQDALDILKIIEKVRNKENVNVYSSFPDSIKRMIDDYMKEQGVQGYSVQSNSIRNMLSQTLIDEFISNITIDKSIDSFNKEMEDLFVKTGEEFSKMYKEYDTDRTKYLQAALEKIPEDDPKRVTVTNVLDSINDAYKLSRLKDKVCKIKIKNFEKEKPEKVFKDFEFKYQGQKYKIFPLKDALKILTFHLKDKVKEESEKEIQDDTALIIGMNRAKLFLLLLCKFCMNYKVTVPEEHAFMYYVIYNIMLLDIYKGEEYKDFADSFIANILEVINIYYGNKK